MSEKLKAYREKRNFKKSSEPLASSGKSKGPLQYVIQHHMARRDHYDFRLEWEGVLLSWAVPKGPSLDPKDKRLAVQVEAHPLDYRSFEGTIPKGEYGGGTVMLWDIGTWEPRGDAAASLEGGSLKFTLHGTRLMGKWALVRMSPKEDEDQTNWLLIKEKDEFTKTSAGISRFTKSVSSGRTMDEIAAGAEANLLRNPAIKPKAQLAKLATSVPTGEDWIYELKYDGYRILAFAENGQVTLASRNESDYTHRFPTIAASLAPFSAGQAMILDGEVVIVDEEGKTDFQALQGYLKAPRGREPAYIIFDLLALNGEDLRLKPLLHRKEMLAALLKDAPENLQYSQHVSDRGADSLRFACQSGMEGIVAKRAHSPYSGTRNGDWMKIKCDRRQELVIGGYTRTAKKEQGVSALLLGYYSAEGKLIYAGRAGTGIGQEEGKTLESSFQKLTRKTPPFQNPPDHRANESVIWVSPQLVAEVKFAEWTNEHLLRQASYKGLREDKAAKEVILELGVEEPTTYPTIETFVVEGITISNPQKILFEDPPITKGDVAEYYAQIAARMLPLVRDRVLSSVRCPKGVDEPCFFKKHPAENSHGIVLISVANSNGEESEYFYLKDLTGLISEVQMGTLEFHTWGSRASKLEKPDTMVFDLDPDEGMALEQVRQGARDLQSILTELSLTAFLKTSGGKGYHIVVPFKPVSSWDVFYDFSRDIATLMEQQWPDRYTANMRKAKRKDRIFIDWIRNGRGATSVAPYSIRARAGAPVSMPIAWNELDTIAPNEITMEAALARLRGPDPWAKYAQTKQTLKKSIRKT